jgi:hypothetical protein
VRRTCGHGAWMFGAGSQYEELALTEFINYIKNVKHKPLRFRLRRLTRVFASLLPRCTKLIDSLRTLFRSHCSIISAGTI